MDAPRRSPRFSPLLVSFFLHASALGAAAALWSEGLRLPTRGLPLVRTEILREASPFLDPPESRGPDPREVLFVHEPEPRAPEVVPDPFIAEVWREIEPRPFLFTPSDLVPPPRPDVEAKETARVLDRAPSESTPPFVPASPVAGACPPPEYPWESVRREEEGIVWLRLRVGVDGFVVSLALEASSGSARLDEAARAAVARWRLAPATRGGLPVEDDVLLPVRFRLRAPQE